MSLLFHAQEGYYSLTKAGTIVLAVLIVVLMGAIAFFKTGGKKEQEGDARKQGTKNKLFSTKQLVYCAAALALAFATSCIKVVSMPWGGSVTLCSMFFVTLAGYWYGPKIGLTAGLAYGILQFIQDGGSYILSPLQACLDYIVAFAALGVSGFFYQQKNAWMKGYVVAILARGLFHSLGGYLYWMEYMPDHFPASLEMIYPIAYNYAYILLEGVITVGILLLPPVRNAMKVVKKNAVS